MHYKKIHYICNSNNATIIMMIIIIIIIIISLIILIYLIILISLYWRPSLLGDGFQASPVKVSTNKKE